MVAPVFQASFADFRLIKGRKVAQFIFELPIEGADAALETLGGVPRPDKESWVGIARLDLNAAAGAPTAAKPELAGNGSGQRVEVPQPKRRTLSELPMSSQAAMRCDDMEFRNFLRSKNADINNAEDAAIVVRDLLGIESRAEILPDTPAGRGWIELGRQFKIWLADSRR